MKIVPTDLPDVLLVQGAVHTDLRGSFQEVWRADTFAAAGLPGPFVQDNASVSRAGVIRGLHYQWPHAQGKLVSALHGSVFDVAVDVRSDSPTFGRWTATELEAGSGLQLWIPPGFAHGFAAMTDGAVIAYKCTAVYSRPSEMTVFWNDPDIGIPWPLSDPIVSDRDAAGLRLASVPRERLPSTMEVPR